MLNLNRVSGHFIQPPALSIVARGIENILFTLRKDSMIINMAEARRSKFVYSTGVVTSTSDLCVAHIPPIWYAFQCQKALMHFDFLVTQAVGSD